VEYWSDGVLFLRTITPIFRYSNTPIPVFLDFRFVNVTPAPVLAGLEGLDDRVTDFLEMLSGVPIR
jgi:hypothetical protein